MAWINWLKRLPLWFLTGLCLIYTTGIAGFFVLRTILLDWPPILSLVNSFVPLLFGPLLFLLPLAWIVRLWPAVLSLLPPLGIFLVLYGPFFLPRLQPAAASNGNSIRVMTFNLGAYRARPEQLAATIEMEDADIVALQELTPGNSGLMLDRLSGRYPYQLASTATGPTGLVSRYPILAHDWLHPFSRGRSGLHVTLDVEGQPLHVVVVHLYRPDISWRFYRGYTLPTGLYYADQTAEIEGIVQAIAQLEGPVVIMGDFNMTDQNRGYDLLVRTVQDAYREAGWGFGFTFPSPQRADRPLSLGPVPIPGPLVRIDYIFHSSHLVAEQAHVTCQGGSDHCYVAAQLRQVEP